MAQWMAVVSAGIVLSTGLAAWTATGSAHQERQLEEIGTYGKSTMELYIPTFRSRLFAISSGCFQRGPCGAVLTSIPFRRVRPT